MSRKNRDNYGIRYGSVKLPTGPIIANADNSNLSGKFARGTSAPQIEKREVYFLRTNEDLSRYKDIGEGPVLNTYTEIPITEIVGDKATFLKSEMNLAIYCRQGVSPITLTADVESGDTVLSVESFTPIVNIPRGSGIEINRQNILEQYQKKTEGEIAGFTVDADGIAKGGIEITGFLDSDTMTGASDTSLPTSESVKAYVDASGGGATQNFSSITTETTTTTSATTGEEYAVVVPFAVEDVVSATNTIELTGAEGVEGIASSSYAFYITNTGYFEFSWNVGTNTNLVNNRILTGVKLQRGLVEGEVMEWTDVDPSHSYIYDRGTGGIRKGSASYSKIFRQSSVVIQTYYRIVFWKEAASNASMNSITLTNATELTIKEL